MRQQPLTDQPDPIASTPDATDARQTFMRLRLAGLTTAEAGNLTAHLTGLRIARRPWTLREIQRLLFLRSLVGTGRLPS